MLTSTEFASRIRAKFPGEYDHLADDDLTARVIAKYPEYKTEVQTSAPRLKPTLPRKSADELTRELGGNAERAARGTLPDAIATTAKDIAGGVMSLGGGVIKGIPSLLTGLPGAAGETARETVADVDRHVAEGREAVGAQDTIASSDAPDIGGQLLTLGKPISKGLKLLEKVPGMNRLARAAAHGSKLARFGENVIQGQLVTFLTTIGRDSGGKDRGEVLQDAALFDAGLTAAIAALPPAAQGAVWLAKKGTPAPVQTFLARQFRWLGNVSDEVRTVFEHHFRTVSSGKAETMEFVEDLQKLTPAERLRVGQRLKGSITSDVPNDQLDAAARQGVADIMAKIDAINADTSIPRALRQKQIHDLRMQRDQVMRTAHGWDRPGSDVDEISMRGQQLLERESTALRDRKKMDSVYYEALSKRELRELRTERGELTDSVKFDLKLHTHKDAHRADVDARMEGLPNILALTRGETRVLEGDKVALQAELDKLLKTEPFAGRAHRIRSAVERIEAINESIQTSYRFGSGGNRWSPRMYLSKEEKESLDVLIKRMKGPKVDDSLRAKRDVFRPERLDQKRVELEEQRDKLLPEIEQAMNDGDDVLAEQLANRRQKIESELTKYVNDEIVDPSYPVAKKVPMLVSDRAATELFETLAKRSDVVSRTERAGFVQLTGKTLGKLDGMYVAKDIASEIREIAGTQSRGMRIYKALERLWKTSKTALNPGTHARNVVGNAFFLDAGGVGISQQPAAYADFVEQLRASSPEYREFRRTGLTAGTWTAQEIEQLSGITTVGEDADEWFDRLASFYEKPGVRDMVRLYNLEDEAARFVMFKRARTELGLTRDQAIDYVDRYIPNYRKIPKNTFTAGLGIASPFYKFTWSSTPILVKNMIEHPAKFAKWWALGRAVNELSAQNLGLSADEEKNVRGVLPTAMQHSDAFAPSLLPLMPRADQDGRTVFLDTTYWIPGNNLVDESGSVIPIQMIDVGNPLLRSIAELRGNRQLYNQRPIYDPVLDVDQEATKKAGFPVLTAEGYGKVGKYLINQAVPTIAGWGRERITRAIQKRGDYAGRVQPVELAVLDVVFGVKTRAFDPAEQQIFRIREEQQKQKTLQSTLRNVDGDGRLTLEEREEKKKRIEGQLGTVGKELERLSSIKVKEAKP